LAAPIALLPSRFAAAGEPAESTPRDDAF